MRLNHADYRKFNEAVAALYRLAFAVGPCAAVTAVLERTIGGMASAATLRGGEVVDCALSEGELEAPMREITPTIMRCHPRFQTEKLLGHVLQISDFLSRPAWHNNELQEVVRPYLRVEDDLGVHIPLTNGGSFGACILRESRTFREEDRLLFSLLLPHIRTLLEPLPALPNEPARLRALGLTVREQEVLFWISEGKRNAEAAAILGISPGTVKRHLENIYRKLGVENRHGAARRALEELQSFRFQTGSWANGRPVHPEEHALRPL